jgi:hypothetical protein
LPDIWLIEKITILSDKISKNIIFETYCNFFDDKTNATL